MSGRTVTDADFRKPEYRDAKPEDYEFRDDGALVRKDRWETGMHAIARAMGFSGRDGFEISDVVAEVRRMRKQMPQGWEASWALDAYGVQCLHLRGPMGARCYYPRDEPGAVFLEALGKASEGAA